MNTSAPFATRLNRLEELKTYKAGDGTTEVTLKPPEKAHNQALRLITGGIKSTPIDAMLLVTESTTICSLIKEKTLILYEKLLRIPMDKFFSTYENRPRHLKMQSGRIKKAIELKKALQIDERQNASLNVTIKRLKRKKSPGEDGIHPRANTSSEQMRSLAINVTNANYAADQWIQVFIDGSYIENQANPTGQETKPLLSLDYVPDTISGRSNFAEKECLHIQHVPVCDQQEEMEKTHLIQCPALKTTTETQR
ncbi:unnamed protein product [Rodentolepis nana]|uniref:Uma2 domain-containing protein n=1 Tax=Rodentolepis nana TaxID=102285 RepID=A0A0R3TRT1_RODNA|nr:unnamed protein product [Rodentolepis nana]